MTVLLEAHSADLATWDLWALLTTTDVTAVLVLHVSEGTGLVAVDRPAFLGPRPALADLAVVNIRLETKGTV